MAQSQQDEVGHQFRWACAGLGGFAVGVCDLLSRLSDEGAIHFVAACDPDLPGHAQLVSALQARGVKLFGSFAELLAREQIDAVWLPVPIALHVAFTCLALEAGAAVLCEKPAAGAVQDVDTMIAARDAARRPVLIAYQHHYDPALIELKQKLAELGGVTSAVSTCSWPRGSVYYNRNSWAGRWRSGNDWVLDGPANNAMAHYLHLPLFLMGSDLDEPASPTELQTNLYRCKSIESYDTACLRVTTDRGAQLTTFFTHGGREQLPPRLHLQTPGGQVVIVPEGQAVGPGFDIQLARIDPLRRAMVSAVNRLIAGQTPPSPVATLERARVQSLVTSAAVQTARVVDVPGDAVMVEAHPQLGEVRSIKGIEALVSACAETGELPSDSGAWPWSPPPARVTLEPRWTFSGPA